VGLVSSLCPDIVLGRHPDIQEMNVSNWKWFFVLIAQIAGAVFGSVLPKAMGATITKELKNEAWNECIVVHQFAYFGLCASFLTALTFKEPFPDLIVCFMLVTFVFFAVGLINTKTVVADSQGKSRRAGQVRIIKTNVWLAVVSFVLASIFIVFLPEMESPAR
jgi:hypothetical protein